MMIFKIYILELKRPETRIIFESTVEMTEKWSKIVTFLAKKVSPLCGVLSRTIPSYILYFATDLGNESFALPVKMW